MKSSKFASEKIIKQFLMTTVHSAQPEIRPGLIFFVSRPKTAEAGSAQNGIQPGLASSRARSATQAATWA